MAFRYRYVGFGTRFVAETGSRSSAAQPTDRLYTNELAVDVGGVAWGSDGVGLPILDHHFFRSSGQFPSATVAVLHHAQLLYEAFASCTGDIWLVTHRDPDFDAWCALYVARCILADDHTVPHEGWERLGLKSEGWFQTREEIDWFHPDVSGLPMRPPLTTSGGLPAPSIVPCMRSSMRR